MTGFFNRRVLYVGPDYTGSNGTCWRDALEDLGYEVTTINSETFLPEPATFLGRVARKVHGHPPFGAIGRLNDAVAFAYRRTQPAFTFYVKATCISAEVLEETAKGGPNFAFMNDDMFNPANQACFFWEGIERLQYIITTKSFNVREFQKAGAPLVAYCPMLTIPRFIIRFLPRLRIRAFMLATSPSLAPSGWTGPISSPGWHPSLASSS